MQSISCCGSCRRNLAALTQHRATKPDDDPGWPRARKIAATAKVSRKLANLDSNRLQMDRMLSAQQIRAARSLLGGRVENWPSLPAFRRGRSRRLNRARLMPGFRHCASLPRTFTAHGVEFVMEGSRSGVTIKTSAQDCRRVGSEARQRRPIVGAEEKTDMNTEDGSGHAARESHARAWFHGVFGSAKRQAG